MTATLDAVGTTTAPRDRWIDTWDPENPAFWEATGKKTARRNLVFSILAAATRANDAGARAFLRKPIVESTFIAAVQQAISAQPSDVMEQQWTSR